MIDWNYMLSQIATVAFDILYFGAIIGTIVIIILDNRNPVKTMAWILILLFLPIVGLVFYFFFGRSQRRERIIGQKSYDRLMEGKQRGIAGMVILTGEAYIHAIPATLIALADELGIPLIEQPYLLKMVIVTERIGTALVRSENALQSQRDILMQLVTGDYPDLQMLHQRALHQQLDFTRPLRLAALRLEGLSRLFRQFPPEQAEAWLLQAHRSVRPGRLPDYLLVRLHFCHPIPVGKLESRYRVHRPDILVSYNNYHDCRARWSDSRFLCH